MDPVVHGEGAARDKALARVLEYRERGRGRSAPARIAVAVLGGLMLLVSVPVGVVVPEIGIPALLVALRLLAVEVDWAARAYAWIDWRFTQARDWFHRQSRPIRTATVVVLAAVAVALIWLLVHEFF